MITLRPYQIEARDAALAAFEQAPDARATFLHKVGASRQSALLAMATGSGKTECVFGTMDTLFAGGAVNRALIVSHTDELVNQPVERIMRDWPTLPVPGIVKAGQNDVGAPIVSASIQTLSSNGRMDGLLAAGAFDLVFYDECHRIGARTPREALEKLYTANPDLRLLGASATPHRSDGFGIGRIFGPKPAYKVTIKDAIFTLGCITNFRAFAARLDEKEHDFSDVRTNAVGDYAPGETGRILSLASALEIIIDKWMEVAPDRPTIAFTASVQQAHDLAAAFGDVGVAAAAIDGTTNPRERAQIIDDFRAGRIQVLCGCAVFIEGFDAPRASCALICRPTQHDGSYIQMMGRALRWWNKGAGLADDAGHGDAVIIDVVPKGARDLVLAADLMGAPKAVRDAEERAKEQGITSALFPLPQIEDGIDADADEVYLEVLDLFSSSPLAWFTDGVVHTLGIGTIEWKGIDWSTSLAIVQNGGFQLWRVISSGKDKNGRYVHSPHEPRLVGKFEDFTAASDAAAAFCAENGTPILNERGKRWRKNEPSAGQLKLLAKLGVLPDTNMPPFMTRGEASVLINHAQCLEALGKLREKGAI